MTKSFLTTAALVIVGSVAANAWDGSMMTSTETEIYDYQLKSSIDPVPGNFNYTSLDPTGVSQETKYDASGTIDFGINARYEVVFTAKHFSYTGSSPASALFTMVNSGGDVSLLFGNARDTMGQLGVVLGQNINTNSGLDTLVSGTPKNQVFSAFMGNPMGYANGTYQYKIVFETFEDQGIDDRIYFEVVNTNNNQKSYSYITASQLGCGGYWDQKFTDIGFTLNGDTQNTSGSSTNGQTGVYIVGKELGVSKTTITTYTRTLTVVPEPSAFGLLAGIGALALVASRRRRK